MVVRRSPLGQDCVYILYIIVRIMKYARMALVLCVRAHVSGPSRRYDEEKSRMENRV